MHEARDGGRVAGPRGTVRALGVHMRSIILSAAAASLMFAATAGAAPACRDKGKFVKCPPAAAAKPARCKDAKGKFAKCGVPGAKPA